MKNKIILVIAFFAFYVLGMYAFSHNWFPKPILVQIKDYIFPPEPPPHINKLVARYSAGLPVFSDRDYYDKIGDPRLDSSFVLQIPRHLDFPIQIKVNHPVKIYRLLSGSKSTIDLSGWDTTDIKVDVEGHTCTHTSVVSKIFNPGIITLEPGGPVAASPIIIKDLTEISLDWPINILRNKYTNHNSK
jgi:hypothetical protein